MSDADTQIMDLTTPHDTTSRDAFVSDWYLGATGSMSQSTIAGQGATSPIMQRCIRDAMSYIRDKEQFVEFAHEAATLFVDVVRAALPTEVQDLHVAIDADWTVEYWGQAESSSLDRASTRALIEGVPFHFAIERHTDGTAVFSISTIDPTTNQTEDRPVSQLRSPVANLHNLKPDNIGSAGEHLMILLGVQAMRWHMSVESTDECCDGNENRRDTWRQQSLTDFQTGQPGKESNSRTEPNQRQTINQDGTRGYL